MSDRHSSQMRWLENHLNLINTYSVALENLDNYRGMTKMMITKIDCSDHADKRKDEDDVDDNDINSSFAQYCKLDCCSTDEDLVFSAPSCPFD